MKRTNNLLTLMVVLIMSMLAACSEDSPPSGETDPDPEIDTNIILIIADDMGWDVFGDRADFDGAKANTPTIDSLAREGVTFHNFWTSPTCTPTRASMLTGKYSFRTGVGGVQTTDNSYLRPDETILQRYIADQTDDKYASAVIGKWHVSDNFDLTAPEDFGVDFYSGIFQGAVQDYYLWTETSAGTQQSISTYTTTQLVDQSISWIDQQSQPFFLWLAFNAPHSPYHLPPLDLITDASLSGNQAAIDADPVPYYLAAIEAMDTEIARLISALTEEERDNTVFIFMGDNGTPRTVSQSPYVGNTLKGTLYQGGVNAPLIIAGKNVSKKNVTETALVQVQDVFPTIADFAGAGSSGYEDGINMRPLLDGSGISSRSFAFTEQFGSANISRDGYAIRNERYKLISLATGDELYYDLQADPFERIDLLSGTLSAEQQQNLDDLRTLKDGL